MTTDNFKYSGERFADIQMLRYDLPGFDELTPRQKAYIYYLAEATLWGRDIIFDQWGKYNLLIRKTLEAIYTNRYARKANGEPADDAVLSADDKAFIEYLKRVWFSNGIHHHYGCDKFKPEFSQEFFERLLDETPADALPMAVSELKETLCPVIFDENVLPKRVNKAKGVDLIQTSACNFYQGVTQQEVEDFSAQIKATTPPLRLTD